MAGEFDNINDIIRAVNDCADILAQNVASTSHAVRKTDEMQSYLGKVTQLKNDLITLVKMRTDDAGKVLDAINDVNADGDDGNLELVASMMMLIDEGSKELNELFEKFTQTMEVERTYLSSITIRVKEMQENQAAALDILRAWTIS